MNSLTCIMLGGHLSHQGGQLSGGQTAQQVHLKKALLSVHESARQSAVAPALSADRHHAELIANDIHRRGETCDSVLTVELRQAAA